MFQGEGQRERRARVKTLFASIDMDGNVATWAERWGLDKDKLKQTRVALRAEAPLTLERTFRRKQRARSG